MSNVSNSSSSQSTPCVSFPNDPGNCNVVANVWRWVSVLSLIGSIIVIYLIYRLDKYKQSFAQRLILSLSLASVVLSVSGVLSDQAVRRPSAQCTAQAFLLQFGIWAVLVWVCCITFNVCWNVVFEKRTTRHLEVAYHVIAWSLSTFLACLPFLLGEDVYGPTGGWCWITSQYKLLRFVLYYIPLYTAVLLILLIYATITCFYNRKARRWEGSYNPEQERVKEQNRHAARSLLVYPIVFLLLTIFPLINRIYQAVHGEGSALLSLVILHALSAPMMGFVNAFVYTWDQETCRRASQGNFTLQRYRNMFGRSLPTVRDYEVEVSSSYNLLTTP